MAVLLSPQSRHECNILASTKITLGKRSYWDTFPNSTYQLFMATNMAVSISSQLMNSQCMYALAAWIKDSFPQPSQNLKALKNFLSCAALSSLSLSSPHCEKS
ncbi:hypothetical protein PoB_007428600 [Plakobranchus ocellatus]|uniref:Uncharacterized protein n=1 Tax=Plakobranchus ocellatus TaxID=259542 RepID=A0AAV4DUK7_9GAST|nr:hypothetical protein PoB_007428600 [Plakobranchus ocellatus]